MEPSMEPLVTSSAPPSETEQAPAPNPDVRYTPRPRITTYMWVVGGVMGVGVGVAVLLIVSPRLIKAKAPGIADTNVVSPLSDETTQNASLSSKPYTLNPGSSPYTPSQYIYLSQSYFADGQTLSQNREQSDEDKKQILSNLQKSLDTISEGIKLYPKRSELWAHRAAIERALTGITTNALSSAIADMETAYTLSPQNPDYAKTLSDLYLSAIRTNSENPEGSRNFLGKSVYYLTAAQELKPNDVQLLYSLAQLQVKAGLLKAAQISFAKLLPLLSDASQRTKVASEKAAVERLLAEAGDAKTESLPLSPSSSLPLSPSSPPSGLELVPEQQVMSRELVVAGPDDATSPYEDAVASSAYSGSANLPKGATSVTVESTRVTATAPIYVAAQEDTNATLTVASKKAGSHFVVSIDAPQNKDLSFTWWILE